LESGPEQSAERKRSVILRIAGAGIVAAAYGLGVYALLQGMKPGVVSFAFLLVQPAAICAFISYITDWRGTRSMTLYVMVPIWTLLAVILLSLFVLKEGVVCVLILSPLWLVSGVLGSSLTFYLRRLVTNGKTYCVTALALPLAAILVEPSVAMPQQDYAVTRSIVVLASPEKIWPLLRGIPDVDASEGCWNISQDIVGIPRPLSARLFGEGIGAERMADWGMHVEFKERIDVWQENRRIGWQFVFDGSRGWEFTDRHLVPDSSYFRVTTGGYTLTPMDHQRTLLTLHTRYWIATPVNAYASLWGELFLGDLEDNLLAIVKGRAER
jgi:hypothetical protein